MENEKLKIELKYQTEIIHKLNEENKFLKEMIELLKHK